MKALYSIGATAIAGAFLLLVYFMTSTANVDVGHVGVVKHWGALDSNVLQPGFHVITPISDNVVIVNTQATAHEFREASAATLEQQNVYVDGKVLYHVDPGNSPKLVTKVGTDFTGTIFDPFFQDFLKEETVKYAALDIQNHRPAIRDAVLKKLQALGATYGVDVDGVAITNFHFDKTFEAAIQDRAASQQRLAQAQIDAQKQITAAQGDAESNRIKQQSLTDQILRQRELDNQKSAIEKWNGTMPTTVVGGGNSSPAGVLIGTK